MFVAFKGISQIEIHYSDSVMILPSFCRAQYEVLGLFAGLGLSMTTITVGPGEKYQDS